MTSQLPLIHNIRIRTSCISSRISNRSSPQKTPYLIGKDPTLLVYDCFGRPEHHKIPRFPPQSRPDANPEQALARLQEFVRFVHEHRAARFLQREVRREMHREGIEGTIKILGESLETGIEFV